MHTLHADVEFSRRKRLHHILNEHDEPVWAGARIVDAFTWLFENGHNEFRLEGMTKEGAFQVMIQLD